jgi:hypothetical protein
MVSLIFPGGPYDPRQPGQPLRLTAGLGSMTPLDTVPKISVDEVIFTDVPTLSSVAFSYDRCWKAEKNVEDSRQLTRWLRRLCGALTKVD